MDTKGLSSTKQMPAVEVTIAVNETHFMIKIADRGNGKWNPFFSLDSLNAHFVVHQIIITKLLRPLMGSNFEQF